ncbi:MAG: hypothetical protein C5B50_22625 [Verrucomicrobia bacterium]|nr:MAG: hypothetical protein C5B50_22625 [Verrucomicrobiota bacterium]
MKDADGVEGFVDPPLRAVRAQMEMAETMGFMGVAGLDAAAARSHPAGLTLDSRLSHSMRTRSPARPPTCSLAYPLTRSLHFLVAGGSLFFMCARAYSSDQIYQVGVAKVDITPDYPVRLNGYAARKSECQGVAQRVWASALAIGSEKEKPAVLITVDNCEVPVNVRNAVLGRLGRQVAPERLAICSTHTHSAPWLEGSVPNIFTGPIPAGEQAHVSAYTQQTIEALVDVALRALGDRRPARLSRGKGEAGFAMNRRTKGGPVDHDLPALFVTGLDGTVRAVFTSYACHCTTLGGDFNQVCGDWAGYAEEYLEQAHPGAVALVALGCAGDANPEPRGSLELTKLHGRELAEAVERVRTNELSPVVGKLTCRIRNFTLPLDTLPTRAEWEAQARLTNYLGRFARANLARLDQGQPLLTKVPYVVQTWSFGDNLTMVFLAGEVVVDYSLRLKREFDASRLWINAYANDVPCYIPSERVLKEGGYEGGAAMVYYDKPTRFAPGVENLIVDVVHELVPRGYCAAKP